MPDPVKVLVPIKSPRHAKSRLRPFLGGEATEALAWAMTRHTLQTLQSVALVSDICILTDDAAVAAYSNRRGCDAFHDFGDLTLAQNLDIAVERIGDSRNSGLLVVPSDLPLLTEERLVALLDRHDKDVSIVAAHRDNGTAAILCSSGCRVPFQFEQESSAIMHRDVSRANGYTSQVINVPGLGFDLDLPEDLNSRHLVDWPDEIRLCVRLAGQSVRCHA